MKDIIERKPAKLQDKLDTPDPWRTVGEIASQMEKQKTKGRFNLKDIIKKLIRTFDSNLKNMGTMI